MSCCLPAVRMSVLGLSWLVAAPAALPAQAAPPADTLSILALLQELDAAFARGDLAGYLARFAPDHPGAHALLQQQLEHTLACGSPRQRTSTLLGEPRRIGAHTAVRVRHVVTLGGPAPEAPARREFASEYVLALRAAADGRLVPTLAVEAAPDISCVRVDFRCPPCNLEVGGAPGWLCVPLRGDRANALEAATFHLLGTDVACDVMVQAEAAGGDPAEVARQLAAALGQLEPGAEVGRVEPWLPPAHATDPPRGLRGARVAVDVAATGRTTLHVVTFGGLQHLLLVRGSAAALAAHAGAVASLLASYRLPERDRTAAAAAATALRHHTGGVLEGGSYHNETFGVELRGEPGWRPELRGGGAAFRVVWTSAAGSRLWLCGHRVPPGMAGWCEATADRWLEHLCRQQGLELRPDAPGATGWSVEPGCDTPTRTLRGEPRQGTGPDARARWLRLLRSPDLLLVADGYAATAADEPALRRMLESLRRRS